MRKILALLTLAIFSFTVASATTYPDDTWWNSEWKYAKIINITENSGEDLTDYQILVNIAYNESMQPDFDDLRFTYYNSILDEEIKIPYWLEEKIDGNSSKIWIKVPFIPANANIVIKIYYGSDKAENESNGLNVFLDFDDFEYMDTPENHGWKILYNNSNTVIETSTNYSKTGNISLKIFDPYGPWLSNSFAVIGRNDVKSGAAEIWFRDIIGQGKRDSQVFMYKDNIYENEIIVGVSEIYSPGKYGYRFVPEEILHLTIFNRTNEWHKFTIAWNETDYKVYIDEKYVISRPGGQPSKLQIGGFWDTDTSIYYWDTYKIRKFTDSEPTYAIYDLEPIEPPTPKPTERSLIITTLDTNNIISSIPTRLPLLIADSLTPEVQKFINEYQPDYIYTLGLSLDLNNSYEIQYDDIPKFFFPEATSAIFVQDRTKAILASNLAYYLHLPIIFEMKPQYEIIDLESKNIDEIQELYVEKLKEKGDNTNYLVLTNFGSEESAIAGYLAGLRRGFIISIFNESAEHALIKIKESVEYLKDRKLFSTSLEYKKGGPLYLAILGNGSSVNFWEITDWFSEMFDDKDGDYIYSDIAYSDINRDGKFELATGRLDGSTSETALNLARQRLPKGNNTVLIGEYRHSKLVDALFAFGGMSQALIIDKMIMNKTEAERIVEKRLDAPRISDDIDELLEEIASFATRETLSLMLGWFWDLPSLTDLGITLMYSLFEFDWDPWLSHPGGSPDHLPIIDGNLDIHLQDADVVGYFGLGDKYWLIPKENRSWTELYFGPYSDAGNFTETNFSGFLYDDHDISTVSEIKRQVQAHGGEVLGSSGIVHDPYTTMSSASFFSGLESGKSLGESLMDVININPADRSVSAVLYPSNPMTKTNVYLCVKDMIERMLFADPAYIPMNIKRETIPVWHSFSLAPSGSFSLSTELESNYSIENRRIKIFNADSYVIEQERPTIPVFVREFILPTNSVLESVVVNTAYTRRYGTEKNMIYNDSYYTNYTVLIAGCMQELGIGNGEPSEKDETKIMGCVRRKAEPSFDYPYPDENYWYTSQTLLDGRIKVFVYVPAFIYENSHTAKILEEAKITVEYESQFDFVIKTGNIPLGEEETIEIKLFNQGEAISGDLYIWVEDSKGETWNFTENLMLEGNASVSTEFSLFPENMGLYSVKALFDSESITIGPRFSNFEVADVEFSLNKKFWPSEIRLIKKKFWPPVNFPEISIKNTGILNITSISISDSLPEGFSIPSRNSFKGVGVENEVFETDDKIPVFIFMISENEKPKKPREWYWPSKKIKMLKREYYNVSFSGSVLTIETGKLTEANFGKDLGKNDTLLIKYLMTSEKIENAGNLTTETRAGAFSGNTYTEKSIQTELRLK